GASRGFPMGNPAAAHLALGDVGQRPIPLVFRNSKGASQDAIAAPYAQLGIVHHRSLVAAAEGFGKTYRGTSGREAMEALLFDKPPNLLALFSQLVVIDGGPVIASGLGIHPLRGLVILVFKIIPKLASHGAATTTYAFGNVYQYTFAHGLYL